MPASTEQPAASSNPGETAAANTAAPSTGSPSTNAAEAPATEAPAADPNPDTKTHQNLTPSSLPQNKGNDSYIVGIADELQISVWKEPDLSETVVVRPDGMITVPVVDDVYVVGLTTKQVQDILTEKLKPVVSEPQVTVIVRNIKSRKVYLVGQVGHPGAVSLSGHETVLQILAESGGPSIYAKTDKIYIIRHNEGQQQKLSFNYKKAIKGNDPKADFPLMNGDVIVVP
jgi:polysaccharide export outer membrane protein